MSVTHKVDDNPVAQVRTCVFKHFDIRKADTLTHLVCSAKKHLQERLVPWSHGPIFIQGAPRGCIGTKAFACGLALPHQSCTSLLRALQQIRQDLVAMLERPSNYTKNIWLNILRYTVIYIIDYNRTQYKQNRN